MRKLLFLLLIVLTSNIYSQCNWDSIFPFKAGNSKFDIARIKSINPTVADQEDKYGIQDIVAQTNNRYEKFDYLKDSVYIRVINLQFVNNKCLKTSNNSMQITLSDDKRHKGKVVLNFDTYDLMKNQYDELLELVPEEYAYTSPFEIRSTVTKEKKGEGIWFVTKEKEEKGDKLNEIGISYKFVFKRVWDRENKKFHITNEIETYVVEIQFTDLRQSKLTRKSY